MGPGVARPPSPPTLLPPTSALHLAVIHEHEAFLDSILQYTGGTEYLDLQNDLGQVWRNWGAGGGCAGWGAPSQPPCPSVPPSEGSLSPQTALHIAVILGLSGFVRKLRAAGAGLCVQERGGHTPLHLACREGRRGCARHLLGSPRTPPAPRDEEARAQLDSVNYDGVGRGHRGGGQNRNTVGLCVDVAGGGERRDSVGRHGCGGRDCGDMAGGKVDAVGLRHKAVWEDGRGEGTVFGRSHAVELWHGDTVGLQIHLGAGGGRSNTLSLPSPAGYTPLHVAVLRKDLEMVELLLSAGADLNKAVSAVPGRGSLGVRCAPLLCSDTLFPFPPPQEPSCGRSPLHLAVEAQSPEVAECLLRAGADPAARMYVGYTPLYSARHRPDPRLPQLLRDFGAQEPPGDSEDSPDEGEGDNSDVSVPPKIAAPKNPLGSSLMPMRRGACPAPGSPPKTLGGVLNKGCVFPPFRRNTTISSSTAGAAWTDGPLGPCPAPPPHPPPVSPYLSGGSQCRWLDFGGAPAPPPQTLPPPSSPPQSWS